MERDPWRKSGDLKQKISTHTLTWSVTGGEIQLRDQDGNFNSHAHVERDLLNFNFGFVKINFNSHAHVERDASGGDSVSVVRNFNSHAHVERDAFRKRLTKYQPISTHTLTWSVTSNS